MSAAKHTPTPFAVGYLVIVQGAKFLGHSGKLVGELSKARVFDTQEQAFINAADYQRRMARSTKTMSVADYAALKAAKGAA